MTTTPEPDYTVLASAADIRAVVRLARMARHLAEDPATDRLAALCERTPPLRAPEYAAEFGHEDDPPPIPCRFPLRPGDLITIQWSGALRQVTADTEDGLLILRDLTAAEHAELEADQETWRLQAEDGASPWMP